jgi:protease-4
MTATPAYPPPPPLPTRRPSTFFGFVLAVSLILNFIILAAVGLLVVLALAYSSKDDGPDETFHSGDKSATDKIAVVQINGVIMEGFTDFALKQLSRAAKDEHVKAAVLRINSPGGSITASEELYRRVVELRDGSTEKKTPAKPLVVSMGGLAASGGYYIAMPAPTIFAERTTMTGSVGVFAAFPNVTKLAEKIGVSMDVIKAGDVKDSGSPFHEMTAKERELWQTMVDSAYLRFIEVVEAGRPQLKGKLQEDIVIDETLPIRHGDSKETKVHLARYRADGGIFTADKAKQFGLIDQIGTLEDAIAAVRTTAGLSEHVKVITYDRPPSLLNLLGVQSAAPEMKLDAERLADAATPRLWYLAPQAELAGITATLRR